VRHLLRLALNHDKESGKLLLAAICSLFMAGLAIQLDRAPNTTNVREALSEISVALWRSSPTIRPPAFRDWHHEGGLYRNWYPLEDWGDVPQFLGFPLFEGSTWWLWIGVFAATHLEFCAFCQWVTVRIGSPRLDLRQSGRAGSSLAAAIAISSVAIAILFGLSSVVNVLWEEVARSSSFSGIVGLDMSIVARSCIVAASTIASASVIYWITRFACSRWARSNGMTPPRNNDASHCLRCGYAIGSSASCSECGALDAMSFQPGHYMPWELRRQGRFTRHLPRLFFWTILVALYCAPWVLGTVRSILH